MARAHEIGVAVDAKPFDQGVRANIIEPLEDAEKALRDLGRSKGADQLEDGLKDAQRATERLDDDLADARQSLEKLGRSAKDAGDDGKRGMGDIKSGAHELQQEIGQNLGEAVSSFRGDITDLGQVGQDTLGGLAATIAATGPAGVLGAAALAAGAAGLGLITAEMQKQQEEADKLRDRLSTAYRDAATEGRNYLDTAALIADASDLMFNPDRAEEWKNLQEDANRLGIERSTIAAANAGDLDAQRDVMEKIAAYAQTIVDKQREGERVETRPLQDMEDRWKAITGETEKQIENNRTLSEVAAELGEKERAQIERTKNADQARYEALEEADRARREAMASRWNQPIKARIEIDDSAILRYRPPVINIVGKVSVSPTRQLIQ